MKRIKTICLTCILGLAMVALSLAIFLPKTVTSNLMNPYPQGESYEKEWKTIDSLINTGLPQSALKLTDKIYLEAKNASNHPQFIKAALYRIKLQSDFQEEFMEKAITDLESEIVVAKTPAKQLLHSIVADLYWRYYQANRYIFLERKTVLNMQQDDFRTWDLTGIMNQTIGHYLASLENRQELQKTNIQAYDAILESTKESKAYRPVLFDFLAHRALDFFMNDESSLIQPAYKFEIDQPEYFAYAGEFIKLKITTPDTLSLKAHALQIFQELIGFHLNDKDPAALTDVDLKRLEFVNQHAIHPEKEMQYLEALGNLEKQVLSHPISTEVSHAMAAEYNRIGQQYNFLISEDHRWELKKAADKCREAIERFPESDGAQNCRVLLSQMDKISLQLTTENILVPGKPHLAMLSFKNTDAVHLRIIRMDFQADRDLQKDFRMRTELLKKYLAIEPVQTFSYELPDTGDFQQHSTELKIPALSEGYYVMLSSSSPNFNTEVDFIAFTSFWASNISYISQQTQQNTYRFYILQRESGQPMKDVKATLFYQTYDYGSRTYSLDQGGTFVSNSKGYFEVPALEKNARPNSFFLELTHKDDKLVTGDRFYHSPPGQFTERKETKTWFFTDRAIYRPGQTIYFKGIVLEKLRASHEILKGHKTIIEFMDVNYQKISEMELVTNEFGSFSGSFTAPQGILTGRMTIRDKTGSTTVLVEEYKRPTFQVAFEPVEGSYRLSEKITLQGNAKAFAGNNITGATVSYRVVRETRFPWRFFFYDFFPQQSSMEITNGTTRTNENGAFVIDFTAIPDHKTPQRFKPLFNYTIYADVTDITGETQSSTTSVNVSQTALTVNFGIRDAENRTEFNQFKISTTNLNGRPVNSSGTLIISLLEEPKRLTREKYWGVTDIDVITERDYLNDFPVDRFKDENRPEKLKVKSTVMERKIETGSDTLIILENVKNMEPGRYAATYKTTDAFGTAVEQTHYFTLYSVEAKKIPVNEIQWLHVINNKSEPGEKATFLIGTKEKNVSVLMETVRENEIISTQWLKLNDEQRRIEIPVTEDHRGGFSVNLYFVKHNRVFSNTIRIEVPYTNKELDFEFQTFRNKLTPGQKEEWRLKIRGKKGDMAVAELLTSMYDASLDAFAKEDWVFSLYPTLYGNKPWSTNLSFNSVTGSSSSPTPKVIHQPVFRIYDQLNWFGFNYWGGRPFLQKSMHRDGAVMAMEAMPGMAQDDMQLAEDNQMIQDLTVAPGADKEKPGMTDEAAGILQIRRNFRETAFFYPNLFTDEKGEVIISFEVPESLTQWKFRGLAHTKDLKTGGFEKEVVTQKELMVVPNAPRFYRQGDKMVFTAKVVNLTDNLLAGKAELQFFHSSTMKEVSNDLLKNNEGRSFSIQKGLSSDVSWEIEIPDKFDVISYRIIATAPGFSDGEEKPLPVLTNRKLVTEPLPLPVIGNETKKFRFDKLINSSKTGTLRNYKLTLEFSSNPAWYAVQALPYLMEKNYESADAIFHRFYANSLALHIVNSNPKIKQVYDVWKNFSPDALLSNLEKNEELKSLILSETPWVMDARSETERKQRIALLFDVNRMDLEMKDALRNLRQKQSPGGGWPWFKGMRDDRYISQQIILGFGRLRDLGALDPMKDEQTRQMMINAIRFLDQEIVTEYERLKQLPSFKPEDDHLSHIAIQYLFARSYFLKEAAIGNATSEAYNYFTEQAKKYWVKRDIYVKGMIALALHNVGVKSLPAQIMASVKEHALYSDEMGMYFRDMRSGFFWYEAPVETQALLIEAFDKITADQKAVEEMKIWLLKQKQTQDWKTTRATAEAVYALLLRGSDWLSANRIATIQLGKETVDPFKRDDTRVEAGTGYFKTSWSGSDIKPEMGEITVTNNNPSIAWGAVYWQYFEDLDKITTHKTPMSLKKDLFVERNTPSGPVIEPVTATRKLKVGDKVTVRIELRVDRDMEYIHMKDMRASAFEPINVLSGYRYQGGLGYYESTLDASTNFFFDYLRKGTYVFEYPLVVAQKGDFSNGITTIQCLYAPEFASHSEGVRVVVE